MNDEEERQIKINDEKEKKSSKTKYELVYEYKLFIVMIFCWSIGIAIASKMGGVSLIGAIIFPPYAFVLAGIWFVDIINKIVGL